MNSDNIESLVEIREKPVDAPLRIVAIREGVVVIGYVERDGYDTWIHDAHVLRRWGTNHGIHQLRDGPTSETVMDDPALIFVPAATSTGGQIILTSTGLEKWVEYIRNYSINRE